MISLKSVSMKNFLSFKEASLDLSKPGLYAILGWNDCGQDSNGSGKSSILEAICYGLFGRTITSLGPDEVRNWDDGGEAMVELALDMDGTPYLIRRTGRKVEFFENGTPTSSTHKKDIQSTINDTFKTSYDLFTSSTFFANTKDFLAAQTDLKKKQLFRPIFQLDSINTAYDKAKRAYDDLQISLDNLESYLNTKEALLVERTGRLRELSVEADKWDATAEATIAELKASRASIALDPDPALVDKVEGLDCKVAFLEGDVTSKKDTAKAWREEWQDATLTASLNQSRWQELADKLSKSSEFVVGSKCECCGSLLTYDNIQRHRAEVAEEVASLGQKASAAMSRAMELEDLLAEFDQKLERLESLRANLSTAKYQLELNIHDIEFRTQKAAELDAQIANITSNPCPYLGTISKLKDQITNNEAEIDEAKRRIGELSKKSDALAFLKWVFSKEGVSAYIIEAAFGRLESLANRYLSLISSEGFQIEIKPQRELKSKAMKEEIDIVVKSGDRKVIYWALSGGQRQRVNVALLLAIYRLCRDRGVNNFDFLLLDEVLDLSMADKGQADTIKLLRRLLSTEIRNIFVISHKDVANDFDYVISIVRGKDKVSSVEKLA